MPPALEPRLTRLRFVTQTFLDRLALTDDLTLASLPHSVGVQVDLHEGHKVLRFLADELAPDRVTAIGAYVQSDTDVGSDNVLRRDTR